MSRSRLRGGIFKRSNLYSYDKQKRLRAILAALCVYYFDPLINLSNIAEYEYFHHDILRNAARPLTLDGVILGEIDLIDDVTK